MSDLQRYSGTLTSDDGESRPVVQAFRQCCHCGYNWLVQPGSGKKRGFCTRCMGYCCGRPSCVATGCVPLMQQIENMEAGRPDDYRPIVVSVPGLPTG